MPDNRPPFDMSRAVFWLVAGVIGASLLGTLATLAECLWHFLEMFDRCKSLQLRDFVTELLALALVLLTYPKRGD